MQGGSRSWKAVLVHRDHTGPVYALLVHRGRILSAGGDGFVLDASRNDAGGVPAVARVDAPIYSMGAARDTPWLMLGTSAGEIIVLDINASQAVQRMQAHERGAFSIAMLPDGRWASAGGDGVLALWSRQVDGRIDLLRKIPLSDSKLRALALSVDGLVLAVAGGDGSIHLIDTMTMNAIASWPAHADGVLSFAFHPTKPVLLSGGKDGHIRVWDLRQPAKELLAIPAHRSSVYALAFSPDGSTLASASRDKTAKWWDATSLEPLFRSEVSPTAHTHSVNALAWDGEVLITSGDDRRVQRWSLGATADQSG